MTRRDDRVNSIGGFVEIVVRTRLGQHAIRVVVGLAGVEDRLHRAEVALEAAAPRRLDQPDRQITLASEDRSVGHGGERRPPDRVVAPARRSVPVVVDQLGKDRLRLADVDALNAYAFHGLYADLFAGRLQYTSMRRRIRPPAACEQLLGDDERLNADFAQSDPQQGKRDHGNRGNAEKHADNENRLFHAPTPFSGKA